MDQRPCDHIMDSGHPCGSPRVNGRDFCHWHLRLRADHVLPGRATYDPPLLENARSVVLALNHLYLAQGRGMIDHKSARHMQWTLRLALQAFRQIAKEEKTSRAANAPVPAKPCTADNPAHDEPCGAYTPVREPITTVCHPERGRMSESKDPDAAEPSTEPCTADTLVRESRVAATDNSPARSAGNPPTNISSPVGTADSPLSAVDIPGVVDAGRPHPAQISPTPTTDQSRVAATDNSPARSAGNPRTNLPSSVGTADTPAPCNDIVTTLPDSTRAELARLGITLEQREELRQFLLQRNGCIDRSVSLPDGTIVPLEVLQ